MKIREWWEEFEKLTDLRWKVRDDTLAVRACMLAFFAGVTHAVEEYARDPLAFAKTMKQECESLGEWVDKNAKWPDELR